MFTGIVEAMGRVASLEPGSGSTRIRLEVGPLADELAVGESVAVNGVCLTVTTGGSGRADFDVVQETLDRSNLGALEPGDHVNLERALRADGRLDGHIVQGHVDGTGRVRDLARREDDVRLEVACDAGFARTLVEKGSVAVDGVSLTVASVADDGFSVALIPHTLEVTTLGERRSGDVVNLEADVLGKYVLRYLERVSPAGGGASREPS